MNTPYLIALQKLKDASIAFAILAETEPCISGRYNEAQERLNTAAKDFTEAALRMGHTFEPLFYDKDTCHECNGARAGHKERVG